MFRLHPTFAAIALTLVDEYVSKKKDQRIAVVESAVQQITELGEKEGIPIPLFLHKVCVLFYMNFLLTTFGLQKLDNWFANHRPHVAKKGQMKSKKHDRSLLGDWSVRKVVQQTMKDRIAERISQTVPDAKKGDDDYISSYQKACTHVIAALSPAEVAECERLADQWNATGPDPLTKAT
jgi:hypothetical protein